jgi:hypothetical protein
VVENTASGKSLTVSPFFPCFTDDDDKQGVDVFPYKYTSCFEAKASS